MLCTKPVLARLTRIHTAIGFISLVGPSRGSTIDVGTLRLRNYANMRTVHLMNVSVREFWVASAEITRMLPTLQTGKTCRRSPCLALVLSLELQN